MPAGASAWLVDEAPGAPEDEARAMQEGILDATGIKLSVGQIIGGATRAVTTFAKPFAIYVVGLAIITSVLDLVMGESGTRVVEQVTSFIAGFLLYRAMLTQSGILPHGQKGGGLGAYFGAALLSGLLTMLGFVFLIVPGLILSARWSIASGLVIAEDRSATQAMRESWEATRASQWSIVLVYVLYFLLLAFAVGGVVGATLGFAQGLGSMSAAESSSGVVAVTNLITNAFGAIGFAISFSILQALQRGTGQLEDVFG